MTYDLTTFQGRLQAIAAGEILQQDHPNFESPWRYELSGVHVKSTSLGIHGKTWPLADALGMNEGTWSLAPKPEKTVTITRKQLIDAFKRVLNHPSGIFTAEAFAKELGLGDKP